MLYLRVFIYILSVLYLLNSCASMGGLKTESIGGVEVLTEYDKFNGSTTYRPKGSDFKLEGGTLFGSKFGLYPEIIIYHEKNERTIRLRGTYVAEDWLFIESGNSLIFLLDSDKKIECYSHTGSSAKKDVESIPGATFIVETAFWEVSMQELREIVNADLVEVRVNGAREYLERYYSKKDLAAIKRFISVFE